MVATMKGAKQTAIKGEYESLRRVPHKVIPRQNRPEKKQCKKIMVRNSRNEELHCIKIISLQKISEKTQEKFDHGWSYTQNQFSKTGKTQLHLRKNSVHGTLERTTCTGGWYVTSSTSGSLRLMLRPLRPVVRRKRRKTFLRGRGGSGRSGARVWNLPGLKCACQVAYGHTGTNVWEKYQPKLYDTNNNTLHVHAN